MTKAIGILFAAWAALLSFSAPSFAWDEGVPCTERPGPRQQRPDISIRNTDQQINLRTPTAEQRYVRDDVMTLTMNISLLAKKSVRITSGYRSCAYTKKIRGRNLSRHTQGNAVDFHVPGFTSQQHFEICRRAGGKGCGLYCGNIGHIDLGQYRQWNHCKGKK